MGTHIPGPRPTKAISTQSLATPMLIPMGVACNYYEIALVDGALVVYILTDLCHMATIASTAVRHDEVQ